MYARSAKPAGLYYFFPAQRCAAGSAPVFITPVRVKAGNACRSRSVIWQSVTMVHSFGLITCLTDAIDIVAYSVHSHCGAGPPHAGVVAFGHQLHTGKYCLS